MAAPYSLENTIRVHDQAVYDWLADLLVDYGTVNGQDRTRHPILRVFAGPNRAFMRMKEVLIRKGWYSDVDAATAREAMSDPSNFNQFDDLVPLPFVSIQRGDPQNDPELAAAPRTIRRAVMGPDGNYINHPWPGHYRCPYTIDFWCKHQFTEIFIREWIYAQLGTLGRGNSETLIPVRHADPFGVKLQSFRFESTSDNSDYEGPGEEFRRFTLSMSLRMWLMRNPYDEGKGVDYVPAHPNKPVDVTGMSSPITIIGISGRVIDCNYELTTLDAGAITAIYDGFALSENLWLKPYDGNGMSNWPVEGNGIVQDSPYRDGAPDGIEAEVTDPTDTVVLMERQITRNDSGHGIISTSFEYIATDECSLLFEERELVDDLSARTPGALYTLPASRQWSPVHVFSLVKKEVFRSSIAGAGQASVANLRRIDSRYVIPREQQAPSSSVSAGGVTEYLWSGLDTVPFLLVAELDTAPGPVNFEVFDDNGAAQPVLQRIVDPSADIGAVFLIQPLASSVKLRLPDTATLASTYLHLYAGPYDGSAV